MAPHGWGRRPTSLAWDNVAEVEVYPVPYGEVLSLRPAHGKTMRIGLREGDRPTDLVAAVKGQLDRSGDAGV